MELEYGEKQIRLFYHELNRHMEYMINLRRSFYCVLCSSDAKKFIYTQKWTGNLFSNRVFMSKRFCVELYGRTFPILETMHEGLKYWMRSVVKML